MGRSRTSSAAELLVPLHRDGTLPLHAQLEQELRQAIRAGRLGAGAVLPSTRALAAQLALSRGVVVEAYEQLVAEGYLVSQPGGATRVSIANARPLPVATSRTDASVYRIDFGYGRPDVTQFPRHAWLRSLRRVLNEAPSDRLSHLDHRGAPELRRPSPRTSTACAGRPDPERMVICNRFAQGSRSSSGRSRRAAEHDRDGDRARSRQGHGSRVRAPHRARPLMDRGSSSSPSPERVRMPCSSRRPTSSPRGRCCPPDAGPSWCDGRPRVTGW
jgi:GntR family transcriptional regulator/MocR family aminotransferase